MTDCERVFQVVNDKCVAAAALEILELIDDRMGKSSLILTSQHPVSEWHDRIGEPTVADALLDRIVHSAHRIEIKGESLRKRRGMQNTKKVA